MARLPLVEPSELPPYLRDLHDGAAEGDWPTRHVARAFASAPELLEHYLEDFYYPWHASRARAEEVARLSPRLKELVRLRIATLNGCKTCKTARLAADAVLEKEAQAVDGYEEAASYSPAERAAIRFAERMALDHHSIDGGDVAELHRYFDDSEILELMMMAGQYIGFGRMLAILELETVACSV